MEATRFLFLVPLLVGLAHSWSLWPTTWRDSNRSLDRINVSNKEWDHIVYTQIWPESGCKNALAMHHRCSIAKNVTSWTVHGIWPSEGTSRKPSFCNVSQPFDRSQITPLYGLLLAGWPNTYTDEPVDSFWKHEWEKHGTCAESLGILKGEYNYFNMGLKLRSKFNLTQIFAARDIRPNDTTKYNFTDIMAAAHDGLGYDVKIQCLYDKKTGVQYLEQLEMCLDKSLTAIQCPHKTTYPIGCLPNVDIIYPMIKHPY